jgi:L-amino acid N-acyltransferase YncA
MEKRVRSIELFDAAAVRDIYAPIVSESATSFEVLPPDVSEMQRRIQELQGRYPWLVFEGGGEVLGYAYASPHRARSAYQWCVEVSAYVHPRARACGIGRALYTALFELLRRQGYVNAYAGIALPNPASIGLHESLGFTPIGVFQRIGFKFGKWHDVLWLHLRLREDPTPMRDPLPTNGIFGDDQIVATLQKCAQGVSLE